MVFVTLAACTPGVEHSSGETSPPAAASGAVAGCPIPAAVPVARSAVLVPGPVNGVRRSTAPPGERLSFAATVLDRDCRPAAGTRVRVWHTDSAGRYGPGDRDCCYYGGDLVTDGNGRFQLDTIRPARYPESGAPPSHIHFEMRHESGSLDTEVIFDGGGRQTAPVVPAHVIPVELTPIDSGWRGEATFVLG
jgi:protocatechuate 3,4-dioxygenase beta subunit